MWFCTGFRDKSFEFPLFQDERNFAVWVVKVAEVHTFCRANRNTGWLFAFFDPVKAERTFIDIPFGVRIPGIIRATGNTGSAADTPVVCDSYNSAVFKMACPCRAATYARCVFAMVAPFGADFCFELRVGSVGHFHNPVAAIPNRDIIFGLAGYHAIRASYTFFCVNCHRIPHDFTSLSFSNLNVTKLPLMPVPPIIGSIKTLVISCESLAPLP